MTRNVRTTRTWFNFGPYWNCNWLSYLEIDDENYFPEFGDPAPDPFYTTYSAEVYGAAGGQRDYLYNGNNGHSDTTFEQVTDATELVSVKIHYPNGSIWTYGLKTPYSLATGIRRYFLTQQADPQGRTTTFNYSTNSWVIKLTNVVDLDGKTNVFNYTNSAWPTLVTSIQDPYTNEVRFAYDANRLMTNIVDVLGMGSAFKYLYTNGVYFLTNLTTPYGATRFEYVNPGGVIYGYGSPNYINRAVRVVEPNGAGHVFMFRDYTPTEASTPSFPCEYSDIPSIGQCNCDMSIRTPGINNHNMNYRNSLYWGPRQVPLLSTTDLTALSQADYDVARLRNWFHSAGVELGDTISMERDLSPDGVNQGQKTWYGFMNSGGFNACHNEGTNAHPHYIAQLLPNGDTRYTYREFNQRGRLLLEVSTWSNGASVDTRTNRFEYSADGIDLLRVYDASGHLVQSNLYNSLHQIIASRNAIGEWTTNTYDGSGRLTSTRTPAGLTTTNKYDANGFLTNTLDIEISRANSFTYTNGLVLTHTDERGLTVTQYWDSLRRPISTVFPDGTYTSNRYANLDLFGTRDRLGNWTYFAYNSARQRTAITNALTNVTTFAYCTCGSLDSTTDALGKTTSFTYDLQGRPTTNSFPDGRWIKNQYDLMGRVTNVLDSAGGSTTNWYNNQGLLVAVSNAFGRVQSSVFDIEDHLTNHVSAEGVSISMAYDDLGRMVWRGYSDGTAELFKHSARGLVAHTNQLSKVTKYGYDAAGRKTAETNAIPEMTYFTYNAAGDLLTLTDGKTQVTTWIYDSFGQATNKTDAAGNVVFTYRYDAEGRLTNRWTPAKTNTFYTYDAIGNLTHVNYAVSPDLQFKYDALNRLTNMSDAVGTSTFGYTNAGALAFEDGPWAASRVSYSYTLGQLTGLTVDHLLESDWQQSYGYDSARRLQSTVSPAGTFTYTYAGAGGMVTNLVFGNGAKIVNTFDTLARLTATRLKNSGGTELNSHTYLYDQAGRRTNTTRMDGSYVGYKYDDIGQLKVAHGSESGGTTNRVHERFGYAYDAAGNLDYRTNNALVQTFNVNNLNQLTTGTRSGNMTVAGGTTVDATSVKVNANAGGDVDAIRYADRTFARTNVTLVNGANTFVATAQDSLGRYDTNTVAVSLPSTAGYLYDLNGNLRTNGTTVLTYDDENQLTQVVVSNLTRSEFTYDGKMRRRIRKESVWANAAWRQVLEVRYAYDGNLVLQERHYDSQLGGTLPRGTVTYTRGLDLSGSMQGAGGIGGLLARSEISNVQSPVHAYYHADGNGNVTALVDANQQVVARYLYDPFGGLLASSGPLAEANLYRFSSKEFEVASGLVYYLYRCYEPALQRWLNRDPLKEFGHFVVRERHFVQLGVENADLYTFVHNSPLARIDILGLDDRSFPMNGAVCNDCFGTSDSGTEVYVLINGQYFTLPAGQCTASGPTGSSDVDGVWICPAVGECTFISVKPNWGQAMGACTTPPSNCEIWNGNPTSPNRPFLRSGRRQNNRPPSSRPPVYRPPSPSYPGSGR